MHTETSKCNINNFYSEELLWAVEYSLILIAVEVDYLGTGFWKVFSYLAALKDNPKFAALWLWKKSPCRLHLSLLKYLIRFYSSKCWSFHIGSYKDSILCLNPRKKLITRLVSVVLFRAKGTTCKSLGLDFENCCLFYRDQLDHLHGLVSVGWGRHGKEAGGGVPENTWPKHPYWSKPGLKFMLRTGLFASTGVSAHVGALSDGFRLITDKKSHTG